MTAEALLVYTKQPVSFFSTCEGRGGARLSLARRQRRLGDAGRGEEERCAQPCGALAPRSRRAMGQHLARHPARHLALQS
jgi:hypothetical protein